MLTRVEGVLPCVQRVLQVLYVLIWKTNSMARCSQSSCYYIGPMFRYERPQAGRFRQFHQLGVEVFGSNDPALDAEVITLGVNYLKKLGLENLDIYINSIGCPECRQEYFKDLQAIF